MSVLPLDGNEPLYIWIVLSAGLFLCLSIVACLILVFRRGVRNYFAKRHTRLKAEFTDYVGDIFRRDLKLDTVKPRRKYSPRVVSEVLLFYFRTLENNYTEILREFIAHDQLEKILKRGLRGGTLGDRTRAMHVLSYLKTDSSLALLRQALFQGSVYVWLVAARGLARRKAYTYVPDIVAALETDFPRKAKLLKTILVRFGPGVIPQLEILLEKNRNAMVLTACLEALAHFDSRNKHIRPVEFLSHADENVRAAALILVAASDGPSVMRHMNEDLSQESMTVRINAAKLACKVRRPEFSMPLIELLEDNNFWVRYWAARGLHALGANGEDILKAMSSERTPAGRMAGDVLLEMDAFHA